MDEMDNLSIGRIEIEKKCKNHAETLQFEG